MSGRLNHWAQFFTMGWPRAKQGTLPRALTWGLAMTLSLAQWVLDQTQPAWSLRCASTEGSALSLSGDLSREEHVPGTAAPSAWAPG